LRVVLVSKRVPQRVSNLFTSFDNAEGLIPSVREASEKLPKSAERTNASNSARLRSMFFADISAQILCRHPPDCNAAGAGLP